MLKVNPALLFYFTASYLVLIANIFGFSELGWIAKSIAIPSVVYYYYQYSRKNASILVLLIFFFCFLGDMLSEIDPDIDIMWAIILFLTAYVFLIKYGIKSIDIKKISLPNIILCMVSLGVLGYVLYAILDLIQPSSTGLYIIMLIYGLTLSILATISFANYFLKATEGGLYFSILALCIVISDIFYSFYYFIEKIDIFLYGNLIFQLASYFFMAKYFIIKSNAERIR